MSETMKNFRAKKAVDAETVDTLLNTPDLDQGGTNVTPPAPDPDPVTPPVTDEFTRIRDEKQAVDVFFKFAEDGTEFIGRFKEVWTSDDEHPFDGILFTLGRDPQNDNSTLVLVPTHSQLVTYFNSNPTPGVLYKIVRIEKIDLKGGRTFVKFAIYQSNQ